MLPAGSRRLKIRPPRKTPAAAASSADASADFDAAWPVLRDAIAHIHLKNVLALSYEQLYRQAYTLVLRKHGARLYDAVSDVIGQHLDARRHAVLETSRSSTSTNVDFLETVVAEWGEHTQAMRFVSDILMYLNRVYVKELKKLLVYDMGVVKFDEHFVRAANMEIGKRLAECVVGELERARAGEVVTSRSFVVQTVSMLQSLEETSPGWRETGTSARKAAPGAVKSEPGLPGSVSSLTADSAYAYLENHLLTTSASTYSRLADDSLRANLGSVYLHEISAFIESEDTRLVLFVPHLALKVTALMDQLLIRDRIEEVLMLPQGLLDWLAPLLPGLGHHPVLVLVKILEPVSGARKAPNTVTGQFSEISLLYALFFRVDPERRLFHSRLRDAIVAQGATFAALATQQVELTSGAKKSSASSALATYALKWVQMVLEYHEAALEMVRVALGNDAAVHHTVFAAVRDFVNAPTVRKNGLQPTTAAPELLSMYMDHNIKSAARGRLGDTALSGAVDETENFLSRSLLFLRLIKDKDAFEVHYAAHFAKRFLNKGSGNSELEELVIAKLSAELGLASLEKISRMYKDVQSSADLTREWKLHSQKLGFSSVDLDLKVCNVSDWPRSMSKDYKSFSNSGGDIGFIWPGQVRETMRLFEEYWLTGKRNENKSLYWSPRFGSMDLRISYPSRTYDINMLTYAGVIMLLFGPQAEDALPFDEKRKLTYEEIAELTKIPELDLKRQLQSIAVAPRLRLLIKSPMSKEINPGDVFCLNENFKSPSAKVKVLTVSSSSSKLTEKSLARQVEAQEAQVAIEEGRKLLVNAAIVRIMKSRRTINHNDLVVELVRQLQGRFQPLTLLIKQRLEDLIEKEYLKRDEDAMNVYHYIA